MEHPTRYDLNTAIAGWRQELAAQTSLTPEVRRELETHLCDAILEFQQRGLNDEEAFWLARKRVGQPRQLEAEFEKEDPAAIWRERMFWMWLAVFLSSTLGRLISLSWALLPFPASGPSTASTQVAVMLGLLSFLIPIIIAVFLAKGKLVGTLSKWTFLAKNRSDGV